MHILNIASAIKNLKVNEIRHFTFGNYYKQIGFSNENSYYSMKSQGKEIYNKSVQQLKIITQQPQTLKNSKDVDIKTVFTENPKTSHKLSKNSGQAEKVSQVDSNSYLNSGTKKVKIFRKLKM